MKAPRKSLVGRWFERAGRLERAVTGALAVIFVVGVLLIADGLWLRSDTLQAGATSAMPSQVTETVRQGAADR